MKRLMSLLMLMSVTSFAGMRAQEKQTEPLHGSAMPMMQMMDMMKDCPMNVQGVEIAVADTPDGIALTLTTKSGNVEELRRRVERLANMHPGSTEKPSVMPGGMMAGVAKYEAVPDGARLRLTPKDPAQLSEFRKGVRTHVGHMNKEAGCSMMQNLMQGMMGGMGKPDTEAKPEPRKEEAEADHETHHPEGKP